MLIVFVIVPAIAGWLAGILILSFIPRTASTPVRLVGVIGAGITTIVTTLLIGFGVTAYSLTPGNDGGGTIFVYCIVPASALAGLIVLALGVLNQLLPTHVVQRLPSWKKQLALVVGMSIFVGLAIMTWLNI